MDQKTINTVTNILAVVVGIGSAAYGYLSTLSGTETWIQVGLGLVTAIGLYFIGKPVAK